MAEKKRAYREINGAESRGGAHGSGKNKHKDKGPTELSPSTLVTGAVPIRLSANEVGDAEDEPPKENSFPQGRTGSSRSSRGSGRYPSGYQRPTQAPAGGNNTPPPDEKDDLPDVSENQESEQQQKQQQQQQQQHHQPQEEEQQQLPQQHEPYPQYDDGDDNSIGSEPEENFGTVGAMAAPSSAMTATQKAKRADELKRSGSVDDRSTSLTGVRLFVANPDLSD